MQTGIMLSAPPILWLFMVILGRFKFWYAFTLFSWDGRGFHCFGLVRVFHDEEHSIESSVLEISSSDNVVHAFRVSPDAT